MSAVELVIEARARDVAGFAVRRALPVIGRKSIGPFAFFDHMGPLALPAGQGTDVGPHPHIGLATVTYLFDGELVHRDSLGSVQTIRPGDVNWMLAGRGIVHSERSAPEVRAAGAHMHGIQSWVALPLAHEDDAPAFEHHDASALPHVRRDGVELRVVAGTAYGERSPVGVLSPTLYVDASMGEGATIDVEEAHEERAVYVASGAIACEERTFGVGALVVLRAGAAATLQAVTAARVMMIGGAKLDGPRHIWWNFVASTRERIEAAKTAWKDRRFPAIPGDDVELVPLPER
jgi:redox-sensitive bicupin YhaK (pirin superfamily)